MAPSSYASDYIEYLSRRGIPVASNSTEAVKPEPVTETVPSRREVRENERVQRESLALAPKVQNKIITQAVLYRTALLLLIIGALLIASVWMGAKATEIKYSINTMTKENVKLEDEITMLGIQIEGAVSFEAIEEYATSNLKMVYPKKNQCFYIDEDRKVDKNLARKIRKMAYKG